MAHTNGHVPDYGDHSVPYSIAKAEFEAGFYKNLAEQYADELRNIPASIAQYGEWFCETRTEGAVTLINKKRLESPMKDRALLIDSIRAFLKDGDKEALKTSLEAIANNGV